MFSCEEFSFFFFVIEDISVLASFVFVCRCYYTICEKQILALNIIWIHLSSWYHSTCFSRDESHLIWNLQPLEPILQRIFRFRIRKVTNFTTTRTPLITKLLGNFLTEWDIKILLKAKSQILPMHNCIIRKLLPRYFHPCFCFFSQFSPLFFSQMKWKLQVLIRYNELVFHIAATTEVVHWKFILLHRFRSKGKCWKKFNWE